MVGNVMFQGSLGWRDHEKVKLEILGAVRKASSKFTASGFREQTLAPPRTFSVESHGIELWRAEGTNNEAEFKGSPTQSSRVMQSWVQLTGVLEN